MNEQGLPEGSGLGRVFQAEGTAQEYLASGRSCNPSSSLSLLTTLQEGSSWPQFPDKETEVLRERSHQPELPVLCLLTLPCDPILAPEPGVLPPSSWKVGHQSPAKSIAFPTVGAARPHPSAWGMEGVMRPLRDPSSSHPGVNSGHKESLGPSHSILNFYNFRTRGS